MGVNSATSDGGIGLQGVFGVHFAAQTSLESHVSRVLVTHLVVDAARLQSVPILGFCVHRSDPLLRMHREVLLGGLSVLFMSILHAREVLLRAVHFSLLDLLLLHLKLEFVLGFKFHLLVQRITLFLDCHQFGVDLGRLEGFQDALLMGKLVLRLLGLLSLLLFLDLLVHIGLLVLVVGFEGVLLDVNRVYGLILTSGTRPLLQVLILRGSTLASINGLHRFGWLVTHVLRVHSRLFGDHPVAVVLMEGL